MVGHYGGGMVGNSDDGERITDSGDSSSSSHSSKTVATLRELANLVDVLRVSLRGSSSGDGTTLSGTS